MKILTYLLLFDMTNMVSKGDKVRFLNDIGGGTVTSIDKGKGLAYVEDEDGFSIPVPISECVVTGHAEIPAPKEETASIGEENAKPEKPASDFIVSLAYTRTSSGDGYDVHIINKSSYSLYLQYITKLKDGGHRLNYSGTIPASSAKKIFCLSKEAIGTICRKYIIRILPFKEYKEFELKPMMEITRNLDPKIMGMSDMYRQNSDIGCPAQTITIIEGTPVDTPETSELAEMYMETEMPVKAKDDRKAKKDNPEKKLQSIADNIRDGVIEIDLHASNILESSAGMQGGDILEYQKDYFRKSIRQMQSIPVRHGTRIIFIHGKGDGRLKSEIIKILRNEFPKLRYEDAPFHRYSTGALLVTM